MANLKPASYLSIPLPRRNRRVCQLRPEISGQ
jgi:hypothetical protein